MFWDKWQFGQNIVLLFPSIWACFFLKHDERLYPSNTVSLVPHLLHMGVISLIYYFICLLYSSWITSFLLKKFFNLFSFYPRNLKNCADSTMHFANFKLTFKGILSWKTIFWYATLIQISIRNQQVILLESELFSRKLRNDLPFFIHLWRRLNCVFLVFA